MARGIKTGEKFSRSHKVNFPFLFKPEGKAGQTPARQLSNPLGFISEPARVFTSRSVSVSFFSLSFRRGGRDLGCKWRQAGAGGVEGNRALVVAADISHPVRSYRLLESSHSQPSARSIILQGPDAAAQEPPGAISARVSPLLLKKQVKSEVVLILRNLHYWQLHLKVQISLYSPLYDLHILSQLCT